MTAEGSAGWGAPLLRNRGPTERRACCPEGGNGAEGCRLAVEEVCGGGAAQRRGPGGMGVNDAKRQRGPGRKPSPMNRGGI